MTPTDSNKLTYTVAEAVRVSNIGRSTLYQLIRDGRLEARKLGVKTLIPAASLRALLATLPKVGAR